MNDIAWYRLAEGTLGVASADRSLAERFEQIYGDCAVSAPGEGPQVICRVASPDTGVVRVIFEDPEPLEEGRFIQSVFPERGYAPVPDARGGVSVPLPNSSHAAWLHEGTLTAQASSPWQPLAANLAVSRLLRLQRSSLFFHAASVSVRGAGLLACGPKRSGKTTLALSLAARGHALLGDEIAALRIDDRALLPFPRSIATRDGPSSAGAAALLSAAPTVLERFPDGEMRTRVAVRQMSPAAPPLRTPLTTLLILRSIVSETRVRPVPVGPALLASLTPLAASLWGRPPGWVAFRLLALASSIRVFEVDAGPPDEVADRIEQLMETT